MASRQKQGDTWYCQFIFNGRPRTVTVGKVKPTEAQSFATRLDTERCELRPLAC